MAIQVGQTLGNYKIVRLLGSGTFGEVYLGENIHIGTQVAIKVLTGKFSPQDLQDFENEARIVAALKHQHIVRLSDFGKLDLGGGNEVPFMVMDYAPNGTLEDRHSGCQVPLPTVVSYVKQIAEALQYAHDNKIIHRDIKPVNIFVGHNDEILVGDFGIAVIAHSTLTQQPQGIVGTVAYMAPEQIQKFPRPASDQYALAIMVYEWLSGTLPFDGTTLEILTKHLTVPPPSLRVKIPTISPAVEQVVFKALEKDYKQRYPRIQDFADALEKASNPPLPQAAAVPQNVGAPVQPVSPPIQQLQGLPHRERLYREGILAQLAGDIERAAELWQRACSSPGLHGNSLDQHLSDLLQKLIPQRIATREQQVQEAESIGDWQREIRLLEQIKGLKISRYNYEYPNTYDPMRTGEKKVTRKETKRISIATQNLQYKWLYEYTQQLINNGNRDAAKATLKTLRQFAPHYGDPLGLAKKADLYNWSIWFLCLLLPMIAILLILVFYFKL